MTARVFVLVLVAGIAATAAGAAPPLARNGRLAFARMQGDNTLDSRIYVTSARGSERSQVSRYTAYGGPEWAPDGKSIAYPTEGGIVITNVDGRGRDRGFDVPGELDLGGGDLDWSPDGKRIATAAGPLFVKRLGRRLRKLTRGWAFSPSWSPDSRLIAYSTPERVFVVSTDGRKRRLLAASRGSRDRPSWSPDGQKLVLGIEGELYVIDVRSGKMRRIVSRRWSKDPLWSPDGRWIAFTRARAPTSPADVYLVRPSGTGLKRLTRTPSYEGSLTWSPTGRRLAFVGRRGDVFVVDLLRRRSIRISRRKCGEGADLLTWSPRGDRFAFRSTPARRAAEIVTADSSGSDIRPLTADCNVWERNPAWSPGGNEVAYDRGPGSERHVYIAREDGSSARRITTDHSGGEDPTWSPDGEQLVFSRRFGDYSTELFVIGRDGTGERQLTDTPGRNYGPAWSPADGRIAFASSRDGPAEIYVMNADGSGAVRLTDGGGTQPAWSSDGSRIAFIRAYDVWTMNADGTNPVRLTRRDGYTEALSPAWSPDGAEIAYSADIDGGRGSQYALFVVDAVSGVPRTFIFDSQDNLDADWQRLP